MQKLIDRFREILDTDEDLNNIIDCIIEVEKISMNFAVFFNRECDRNGWNISGIGYTANDVKDQFNRFIQQYYE